MPIQKKRERKTLNSDFGYVNTRMDERTFFFCYSLCTGLVLRGTASACQCQWASASATVHPKFLNIFDYNAERLRQFHHSINSPECLLVILSERTHSRCSGQVDGLSGRPFKVNDNKTITIDLVPPCSNLVNDIL